MHVQTKPSPLAISVSEAARQLGLGKTKVYELLASGELESLKVGRRRLVIAESVRKLLDRLAEVTRELQPLVGGCNA